MNDSEYSGESSTFLGSIHLPIALLALGVAINFLSELRSAGKSAEVMRWQLGGLDRQTETLSAAKRELAGLIMKNDEVVRQAQQIQGQYTNMFGDLIDLAKDDKDAKEIVDKWGIKRTGEQPAPPPAPAPTPEASKPANPAPAPDAPKSDAKPPALR